MLKILLVLLVVGIGVWSLVSRLRGPRQDPASTVGKGKPADHLPVAMVACAQCGLHLPAADAVPEGPRLYCSDAHRRLGPAPTPPAETPPAHTPPE
ncbi:MAG: PP0621 family protein [Aquabacterium sp.]|nr:PP0621 family protein [Aquabacterium sp.]